MWRRQRAWKSLVVAKSLLKKTPFVVLSGDTALPLIFNRGSLLQLLTYFSQRTNKRPSSLALTLNFCMQSCQYSSKVAWKTKCSSAFSASARFLWECHEKEEDLRPNSWWRQCCEKPCRWAELNKALLTIYWLIGWRALATLDTWWQYVNRWVVAACIKITFFLPKKHADSFLFVRFGLPVSSAIVTMFMSFHVCPARPKRNIKSRPTKKENADWNELTPYSQEYRLC